MDRQRGKLSTVNRHKLLLCDADLDSLVREVIRELETGTASRKIEWHIGKLGAVRCDPGLVRQVFSNLISNAIKYTRPRGPAVIGVARVLLGNEPVFEVRDNGVGFDAHSAEKLFTAFQRFHRAEIFEGTGIGLATVQRIISRHGGRIWAEAEIDKGATFRFTFGNIG